MAFFNHNLKNLYKNIKSRIPGIKIKNQEFMNKLHSLDLSSDFWWALSGEYALTAEYLSIIYSDDPRFKNYLINSTKEFPTGRMILSAMIKLVGRDFIIHNNSAINSDYVNKNIDELLIEDEEKNFSIEKINLSLEIMPLKNFTIFLTKLRLKKFKNFYLKIKKKLPICNNRSEFDKEFYVENNLYDDFEIILNAILPEYLNIYFPKWFLKLSKYLVNNKQKWVTKFGYERNIYDIILMSRSYEKYGTKNIQVIAHGTLGVSLWHMFRLSLFPNLILYNINQGTYLPKVTKKKISGDILFCPAQFPALVNFFSISHYQEFMKVYRKAIKLLNNGIKNGKEIRIRYKNFQHVAEFAGPHLSEEYQIPIENKKFEDVYNNYKLIVSMPFGTISDKCYQNNINCITYNYPYYLMDKKLYLENNTYPGVFKDSDKFLTELEKKIKEF